MDAATALPALAVLVVAVVSVVSGPVGPVDLTTASECSDDVFVGDGNATVTAESVPDEATLSKSAFGAAVWRLQVPPTRVGVADVQGRPTVSFRIHLHELGRTVGTTTVLSRCTTGTVELSLPRSTFEPDAVTEERYRGTVTVVYRGTADGASVERRLVRRNVTVTVTGSE
jgi:hypothetical protein